MQHPKCCTESLIVFNFDPTSSSMLQHIATYHNRVARRMQHVVPNNVARCCVEMLRAFGQAFIVRYLNTLSPNEWSSMTMQVKIFRFKETFPRPYFPFKD